MEEKKKVLSIPDEIKEYLSRVNAIMAQSFEEQKAICNDWSLSLHEAREKALKLLNEKADSLNKVADDFATFYCEKLKGTHLYLQEESNVFLAILEADERLHKMTGILESALAEEKKGS